MPKYILEAASSSCALVTTDVVGCRESIIHEETGDLVRVKNFNDIFAKLENLINNPIKIKRYGRNGLRLANKEYSIENFFEKTKSIYDKII
tara:strand:+ start:528 stop:800 length:273 start_codon:yes stop_codon:yes gene_type:complete